MRLKEIKPGMVIHCKDYEETIKKTITLEVEETLKRYCIEHDGDFIDVHEVVSRAKK